MNWQLDAGSWQLLLAYVAIQSLLNVVLRAIADELLHDLSILEDEQSWNAGDFVAHGGSAVAVHVHLSDLDFALILAGQLFHDGSDRAAGATPGCPKIQQHGRIGLQDIGIKISVGDLDEGVACHSSSRVLKLLVSAGWTGLVFVRRNLYPSIVDWMLNNVQGRKRLRVGDGRGWAA